MSLKTKLLYASIIFFLTTSSSLSLTNGTVATVEGRCISLQMNLSEIHCDNELILVEDSGKYIGFIFSEKNIKYLFVVATDSQEKKSFNKTYYVDGVVVVNSENSSSNRYSAKGICTLDAPFTEMSTLNCKAQSSNESAVFSGSFITDGRPMQSYNDEEKPIKSLEFSSFPPRNKYNGKVKLPDFKNDPWARDFRTRIKEQLKLGPNFGNHYSILITGCGSSCTNTTIINMNNGKRIEYPLQGEGAYQQVLRFYRDSLLIKSVWNDTDAQSDRQCVYQDYTIENDKIKLLNEYRTKIQGDFCQDYQ